MFKYVFVLSVTMAVCQAYGGSGGYGGSSQSAGSSGGYGSGSSAGYGGNGGGSYGGQRASLAIQTRQSVDYYDVPMQKDVKPTTVEVGSNSVPLQILFRSASSNLNIQQAHDGAQGSTQESQSEDEPHVLKHSVTKPIIQEINEVITPFRRVTQQIQPVQEEVLTIVARGQEGQQLGGGQGVSSAGFGNAGSSRGNSGLGSSGPSSSGNLGGGLGNSGLGNGGLGNGGLGNGGLGGSKSSLGGLGVGRSSGGYGGSSGATKGGY